MPKLINWPFIKHGIKIVFRPINNLSFIRNGKDPNQNLEKHNVVHKTDCLDLNAWYIRLKKRALKTGLKNTFLIWNMLLKRIQFEPSMFILIIIISIGLMLKFWLKRTNTFQHYCVKFYTLLATICYKCEKWHSRYK